tara:strand:- start:1014 stop:1286 length:273 start_codon:yes stop_codon:yes gene_type:complete
MSKPTKKQIAEAREHMAELRRKQEHATWFSMVQLINEKLLMDTPFYLEVTYDESLGVWVEGGDRGYMEIEGESAIDFIRGALAMKEASEC